MISSADKVRCFEDHIKKFAERVEDYASNMEILIKVSNEKADLTSQINHVATGIKEKISFSYVSFYYNFMFKVLKKAL